MQLEKPLGYLLGKTLRIYKNRLTSNLREADIEISFQEFIILHKINEKYDLTQQDLANHFQKDKSFILRLINNLIEKRFVVRLPDNEDKRKKNLIMTQKGIEVLEQTKEVVNNLSDELLSGISNEDLYTFQKVLKKIEENSGLDDPSCNC
ncbi:MarR family winged helix-turn-helix transcriptional regulator [Sunxiuqinia sp. A32]|uniref:MarR family winged helix-turn-helix transcriptional regulator n=1 Tax=Sunxiuqinia sp. A32 TaxID=3461496 RepID=UPI004045736A